MKRLRSTDDINSFGEKSVFKDWGRRDDESSLSRSSSHRNFHYKPENGHERVSPSFPRYDDDRETSRFARQRSDYDLESYDNRRDRYSERGIVSSSPRSGYSGGDRIHRSESFSRSPRREIPKGFRSERDRSRREGSVSSWRRFGVDKDNDDSSVGGNKAGSEEKGNLRFSGKMRDGKCPLFLNELASEQSKSTKMKDSGSEQSKSNKIMDSGSEYSKSTKNMDLGSEQSKNTKMKDSGSEQLKSTKIMDSVSEYSKSTKNIDLGSEQSKSTIMKDSGSELLKSTTNMDSGSEYLKTNKIMDLGSEQSKSNKMKDSGSEYLKSTKITDSGSEFSKSTKIMDLGSEQLKRNKMKDLGNEYLKSTKIMDSGSEQSKSNKMKDSRSDYLKSTKFENSEQSGGNKMKDLGTEQSEITKMKDSGREQTKIKIVTMTEDPLVESGCNSEMEEGELEPEPEPEPELEVEPEQDPEHELEPESVPGSEAKGTNVMSQFKLKTEELADNEVVEDKGKPVSPMELSKDDAGEEELENGVRSVPELKSNQDSCQEKLVESQISVEGLDKALDESTQNQRSPVRGLFNENAFETAMEIGGCNEESRPGENHGQEKEGNKDDSLEELMPMKEENKEGYLADTVIEVADTGFIEPDKGVRESSEVSEVGLSERMYDIFPNFKDKGKSVVASLSNATGSEKERREVPNESKYLLNFERDDMDGPSTRGLDLFLNHPVRQPEKQRLSGSGKPKDEKLELEPFDLSLSLPNVLLPIDPHNRGPAPSSPSHARSIQSIPSTFRTNSDGFTASMSFTGSHSFRHNPSCSLTNNTLDQFERSVSSRPLFGRVDQVSTAIREGQHSNERLKNDVPVFQKALSNGDEFLIRDRQLKVAEGCSVPSGQDRQLSFHRQLSSNSRQNTGSHENRSEYSNDKNRGMRKKVSSSLYKASDRNEEQFVTGGSDSVEPIITMIVSESVDVMTKKFNEMNEKAIIALKEGARDIIVNAGKHWQLLLFQKALNNRSDITLEMLLKTNRSQLEILVALKTGVCEFLQRKQNISSSDMAEIFLNLRCRNLTCRNLLPVDECDCKVCIEKSGFCSSCMCLVCSKYDMASNTCSWVGCDVCLHWCHADCALQNAYIRNGTHGLREVQFHCVACDHPSEMFGFVKEVFQTFAKEWTLEKLSKELEYVKKIFSASEDLRGKQLYDIAVLMLSRLTIKADFREVQNQIMSFLAESGSANSDNATVRSGKELFSRNQEGYDKIGGPSQEAAWLKPLHSGKAPALEQVPSFKSYSNNTTADLDLQMIAPIQMIVPKEHAFDELESIVRIKEVEAKMFQTRADDARREAEGLKRIATAKNQKIEEEYASRISKLRLLEAEETRKQKIEELQGLERAYRDYFTMKRRMEADIRDLLSKMEATKRSLAM